MAHADHKFAQQRQLRHRRPEGEAVERQHIERAAEQHLRVRCGAAGAKEEQRRPRKDHWPGARGDALVENIRQQQKRQAIGHQPEYQAGSGVLDKRVARGVRDRHLRDRVGFAPQPVWQHHKHQRDDQPRPVDRGAPKRGQDAPHASCYQRPDILARDAGRMLRRLVGQRLAQRFDNRQPDHRRNKKHRAKQRCDMVAGRGRRVQQPASQQPADLTFAHPAVHKRQCVEQKAQREHGGQLAEHMHRFGNIRGKDRQQGGIASRFFADPDLRKAVNAERDIQHRKGRHNRKAVFQPHKVRK